MHPHPHFKIAGIPVRIEPVFWIVTAFLGFNLGEAPLIIIWVGVVLVSVLVHELGHAIALKAFGQPSSIVLHGFGGVTMSNRRLARTKSIIVSVAGPFAALGLLGIPAMLLRDSDYGLEMWFDYRGGFGLWPVVVFAVWVNVWWSIANLLPIRPLDGGNVMTELVGLDAARLLSVVVGAAAAIWAYFFSPGGLRYAAFFAGFLAFINLSEYRRSKQGAPAPSAFDVEGPEPGHRRPTGDGDRPSQPPPRRSGGWPAGPPSSRRPPSAPAEVSHLDGGIDAESAESFAWNLLRRGDATGAKRALRRANGAVGPFVGPTAALAAGDGIGPLTEAYLANPGGPSNLVPASVAADSGQVLPLAQALVAAGPTGVQAAGSIQTHLHYAERFDHAAAVGEVVYAAGGTARAQTAFDVACSWSRADQLDRALTWIGRAVDDGFGAASLLDGEPDLAPLRAQPGWSEVRARLA